MGISKRQLADFQIETMWSRKERSDIFHFKNKLSPEIQHLTAFFFQKWRKSKGLPYSKTEEINITGPSFHEMLKEIIQVETQVYELVTCKPNKVYKSLILSKI
jgi:hypothetical protein